MGFVHVARAPGRIALLLAVVMLSACGMNFQRHSVNELRKSGELHRAREVLAELVASADDPGDRAALAHLDDELSSHHYQRAVDFLRRGFPEECYRELGFAVFFGPDHVTAKCLADELWDAHEVHRAFSDRLRAAIDGGDWEQALDLVVDAPDTPYSGSYWRRSREFLELVWNDFQEVVESAAASGDAAVMNDAIADAAEFNTRHGDLMESLGLSFHEELAFWRRRSDQRVYGSELRDAARACRTRGEHAAAYRLFNEALYYVTDGGSLRQEIADQRETLCDFYRDAMRAASDQEQWTVFLRARHALEALGAKAPELDTRVSLETARECSVEELIRKVQEFRARRLPGNALLALAEAMALSPENADLAAELAGFREQVLALPLLEVRDEESADAPTRVLTDVVVRRGRVEYSEERAARMVHNRAGVERVGARMLDNPAHLAEKRLVEESRREVERLQALWMNATALEKDHTHRRYLAGVEELERIEKRLQALPDQEPRITWKQDAVSVETRELVARLDMILTLIAPGCSPVEHRLSVTLRHLDDHRPADHERNLPGDPDDLPSAREARKGLEGQVENRLEEWLDEVRRQITRTLLHRACWFFDHGLEERAVELVVRALLDPASAARSSRESVSNAWQLLERWTQRPASALGVVFPSQ